MPTLFRFLISWNPCELKIICRYGSTLRPLPPWIHHWFSLGYEGWKWVQAGMNSESTMVQVDTRGCKGCKHPRTLYDPHLSSKSDHARTVFKCPHHLWGQWHEQVRVGMNTSFSIPTDCECKRFKQIQWQFESKNVVGQWQWEKRSNWSSLNRFSVEIKPLNLPRTEWIEKEGNRLNSHNPYHQYCTMMFYQCQSNEFKNSNDA